MFFRKPVWGLVLVSALALVVAAQQRPAAQQPGEGWAEIGPPNPAEVRGQKLFISNCSFCHGADGSGKSGPDLLRSTLVVHDVGGKQIGEVVHAGRPGTPMPAFPSLTDDQIADIAAFLHRQTKAVVARFSYQIKGLLTGDAKAGEAFFDGAGKCNTCHSPTGDLAHIASKYEPPELQHLFMAGYNGHDAPDKKVTVTLPTGETVSGTLLFLDEFDVSMRDSSGQYHSWERNDHLKVQVRDPIAPHQKLIPQYTDSDMHNILAYLETLK